MADPKVREGTMCMRLWDRYVQWQKERALEAGQGDEGADASSERMDGRC